MNFNIPLLKPIRILLFPFSLIYALLIIIRNRLYDKNVLSSTSFNLPLICIGNLSVGGTGKSPMVEWIIKNMKDQFKIAVLSRGYKRKTKGYALADRSTSALEIGDEPMLFHMKFPDVTIAVGEERLAAIPQLLHDRPATKAILLDDAFQHRRVKAGLNILLTDYNNLYTRDWFLPTGDLRDEPGSYKRANIIIVTKCPPELSNEEQELIKNEIRPVKDQKIFYTYIKYGLPYQIVTKAEYDIQPADEVLLVTGIANPKTLKQYLADRSKTYYEMNYNDHHIFTIDDLREIRKRFENLNADQKLIITTEKDAVRLFKFEHILKNFPLYVVPIQHVFLNDEANSFLHLIGNFISSYNK